MSNTLIHFEIAGEDPERLGRFYAGLFGWKVEKAPMPGMEYWLIETAKPGKGVNGGIMRRSEAGEGVRNYIQVDDIDRSIQRVKDLGGQITTPKTEVPGVGFIAIANDPQGNPFGFVQPPQAPARPRGRAASARRRTTPARPRTRARKATPPARRARRGRPGRMR